jgi:hypothetical protein
LTRIKRPEFYAALSNEKVKNVTNSPDTGVSNDFSKTRLNSLILSVPVPTYRGAFVIALGVNRVKSFDKTYTFQRNTFPGTEWAVEEQTGGMQEWSAGAGVSLSPRLSVGATLIYDHGKETYFWNLKQTGSSGEIEFDDNIESVYSAVGARLGLDVEINQYVGLSLALDSPRNFLIKQDYVLDSSGTTLIDTYEYHLTHPYAFAGGLVLRRGTALVECDLTYEDWSQMEYKNKESLSIARRGLGKDNRVLRQLYDQVFTFSIGAEYVIPSYGVVLRGGFKHDPLPISGTLMSNQIEKDRNSFSAGLGFLIDKIVMLDIAYAHAGYKIYDGEKRLSEEFTSDRVMVSIGYRI